MKKTFSVADLFCGAGGTSSGALDALQRLGLRAKLTAINHWSVAVATHTQNHPKARHLCASLDALNPRELYADGELDLLWASPECTHHSVARGGKPINDQSRATAWCVVRWAEALRPPVIMVENVPEFRTWGPIGSNGKPLKSRKGEVFRAWCSALEAIGYTVDHRILCAADYGDPTTRRRLFVQAVRGKRSIVWPEPTHGCSTGRELFGERKPWRSAREIIDWNIRGESILDRKRPLAPRTLARIEAGLKKFGGEAFLVVLRGGTPDHATRSAVSVEKPLATVAANGTHHALCEPFLLGQQSCSAPRKVGQPVPTVSTGGAIALVQPFIIPTNYGERSGQKMRTHSVDNPMPTVVGSNTHALVEPFIIPMEHSGAGALRSVNSPLPTITTAKGGAFGMCQPFLTKYYGTGNAVSVQEPMDTVTARDRFALVEPRGMDILFRMLQPHELAGAQGFPAGYKFEGNKTEQVKQIGNAVPCGLARALVLAQVGQDGNVSQWLEAS